MSSHPLDADRITSLLGPATMWRPLQVVEETMSTNADVGALAAQGAEEGLVRVAAHQTGGRGRFDRQWCDVPGTSVALSILLRPTRPAHEWGWLSLLAGMAVAGGIRDSSRVGADRVSVKWPNDVLVDGRKVCGILSESDGRTAVVGIGVNVAMTTEELPVPTATSLLLAGLNTDKNAVVAALLANFEDFYRHWCRAGDVRADYAATSGTIGTRVRVIIGPDEVVEGRAVGIDGFGSLLVETPAGVSAFAAGDVVHLR